MLAVVSIAVMLALHDGQLQATAPAPAPDTASEAARVQVLEDAQRSFYSGHYDVAAAAALALCVARPDDLEACELRTSSLLFQIKRALGDGGSRDATAAWKQCAVCPGLMSQFLADTASSQLVARARLKAHPEDPELLFLLGKLDLNYVWLQLGTLGRKTGWGEYWEARRSLDHALQLDPEHVRARVARAWVDYIVGTRVPRGVRWLLGGGNRTRGLDAVRRVVEEGSAEAFVRAEAMFALWDMQVREKEMPAAVATARMIARDFPENAEVRRFLTAHGPPVAVIGSHSDAP